MQPYYDDGKGIQIYLGDCKEVLPHLPKIDLCVTDPPYVLDIGAEKYSGIYADHGAHLKKIRDSFGYNFDPLQIIDLIEENMNVFNGYFWTSEDLLPIYIEIAKERNWKWHILCWCKVNPMPAHFNHRLNDIEFCIHIFQSGAYFNNELNYIQYFSYFVQPLRANKYHPTPKPSITLSNLIIVSSRLGDLILDPFLGTGTTLIEAKKLGRRGIGIEIDEKYCKIAADRLGQSVMNLNI